ncbi:hypothetical protein DL96DRAFT_1625068 [Flagelloscypha sp. PMI_526]|nr:hypothetical protein DL96DRAFT_1625068 [Flagelloscypha sp. PMI_526]
MGTPRVGTIQHSDLERVYIHHSAMSQFWREWGTFIAWLFGITLGFTAYNIGACALGRFFLDHFHIWDRTMPPYASEIDRHAELIAALVASWLSTPGALGLLVILFTVDDWLRIEMKAKFQFIDYFSTIVVVTLLTEWSFLLVAGAMLRPRFHYINLVALQGVYWFGSLILLPVSIPIIALSYRAWNG